MLALKPKKSSKKEYLNPHNNITKRHKFANALTAIALTILHKCAKQRPGASNAL
jgi:hypothetical protein